MESRSLVADEKKVCHSSISGPNEVLKVGSTHVRYGTPNSNIMQGYEQHPDVLQQSEYHFRRAM